MRRITIIYIMLSLTLAAQASSRDDSLLITQLKSTILACMEKGGTYETVAKKTIVGKINYQQQVPPKLDEQLNLLLSKYQKVYTAQSPQYAEALTWCAWVCGKSGDHKQAFRLLNTANNVFKRYGNGPFRGRDTINQIYYNDVLSFLEEYRDNECAAIRITQKNLNLKRQYFGDKHSVYLSALLELSRLYAERWRPRRSRHYHNLGYNAYINLVKQEFCSTSESERTLYWNTAIKYINKTMDLAYRQSSKKTGNTESSLAGAAYNALLLSKGLLLNTSISFEQYIMNSGNYDAVRLLQLKKIKATGNTSQNELDSLDYEILDALKSQGQGFQLPQLSITWQDIAHSLDLDDVAIEFYRTGDGNYGAVVVKKDWKAPKCVQLGRVVGRKRNNRSTLNNALKSFRIDDEHPMPDKDMAWNVSRAVWTNELLKYFPQTAEGRVFFSADGEMQITGIEYLPFLDPRKQYRSDSSYYCIADVFPVYRLSSTRELIYANQHDYGNGAAIYGGLVYSMGDSLLIADNERYQRDMLERRLFAMNVGKRGVVGRLCELEGTQIEADSITNIINSKSSSNMHPMTFTKEQGTEASFKALDGKRTRLMHIATHGFYYSEKDSTEYKDFLGSAEVHPMARSGLMMSGAETRYYGGILPIGIEDGILTSLEISGLDLRGLDLVALSACQTGQGDIGADGVFGLQRGFKMASANSILMSLWKVDDEATQTFMTRFYSEWMSGKSKRKAFEAALNCVRSDNRWQSPEYWAAFILLDALD